MAAERLACCSGPVMRVSAGSMLWAARNTAISAVSWGWLATTGPRPGGGGCRGPFAGGGADLVGELGDELGAVGKVGTPLRVGA